MIGTFQIFEIMRTISTAVSNIRQMPAGSVTKIGRGKSVGCQPSSDYVLARLAAGGGMTALGDLYERYNRRSTECVPASVEYRGLTANILRPLTPLVTCNN